MALERPIRIGDFIQCRETKLYHCCGFVWDVSRFIEYEQPICGRGWRVLRENWWESYRRLTPDEVKKLFDLWFYRYASPDRIAAYHRRWIKLS